MSSVITHLVKAIRDSAVFNPDVQVAPSCILWPDKERQWEAVIPQLQSELGELFVLGEYVPESRKGPAIWLRCVLANKVADVTVPVGCLPVIYLPGVSRQDLRAIESCPELLKPLAELQYRGVIWSQSNAKDWTIMAFLKSSQGGLGIDVAQDSDTKNSMQLSLYRLLEEEYELLKGKRLDKDYFNTLLTSGDLIRDLLQWINEGDSFKTRLSQNEWGAFVEVCKSQLAFNPQNESVLTAAYKLATHEGVWLPVWERFIEAPNRYPNIPTKIRQCKMPNFDLFASADIASGWPQWNDEQENDLRRDLLRLNDIPAHDARKRVIELEADHSQRRSLVWSELGYAPLAEALKYLNIAANVTSSGLAAGSIQDLQSNYTNHGWQADDAVLSAISSVDSPQDVTALTAAIRSIYLPWLEDSARYLQKLVDSSAYPGATALEARPFIAEKDECVLFVDGLRFDTARRLSAMLQKRSYEVNEQPNWAALPSVTATGKAAVSPVRDKISGAADCDNFEPSVSATGQPLNIYHLHKLLKNGDWQVLDRTNNGDGKGKAWCEFGDIDNEGHARGVKLAKHIDPLLEEITERVVSLFAAGWSSIRIVTDHGWLLMPGKLPKIEMINDLTDNKWGRCASIKPGAATSERLFPWYWNPTQQFALAEGISCYRKSEEYTHGGLSLQECLTLELFVTNNDKSRGKKLLEITDIKWTGLRCKVVMDDHFDTLSLDIRVLSGNPKSSIVVGIKQFKKDGTASVVIENEDLESSEAFIVLLDSTGEIVAEEKTVIGGA